MLDDLPDTPLEQARMMENILVATCEGYDRSSAAAYVQLRGSLVSDDTLKLLLPGFVRTCRDLNHFWSYAKGLDTGDSGHWWKRKKHVRDGLTPLFDYLEQRNSSPVDNVASDALRSYDADGVHAVWVRALERRHLDAEGVLE